MDESVEYDKGELTVPRITNGLNLTLLEDIDGIDMELLRVEARKVDWKKFMLSIRKNRIPSEHEAALYIGNMSYEERGLYAAMIRDIDAEYPGMSSFDKKIKALEMVCVLKEEEFSRRLLDLAMKGHLSEEEISLLDVYTRVQGNLIKKRGYISHHFSKQQEIGQRGGGDLKELLNNPEIEEFRLSIKKKSREYTISKSAVENAEWEEVE